MLTIYVDPKKQNQVVQLSDQDRGYLSVQPETDGADRYTFTFTGHAHPSFWHEGALTDGLEETVRSIDGTQKYQILFR
ncbi:hypothetical protein FD30_GL000346 [Levilactobacillus namurensis DSM 19117]|uniref:Uncharacterized protein n=2 Tax=Levilactobacillus namurensis TaxID=380393 RepID=A0A0R1JQ95_9LACO|nr:hypothetical protein [Levilactobacillus namurensis]PTM21401.1 hypothetical protein DA798_10345 [Lactobacillus sp. PFC-70]KRK73638.1 hypothetical protein FD30_GL000346 [Levilactobacillus namurensis DSM 19117]MCW3779270.1 hypothetical protein [Levilactobacillus namurensis]MDT7013659.1 hypothetical protein [Levilactobacillus namurensis]MDT7019473.1 hypothetical protein [Levilactobacillus namurensis]